MDHVLQSQMVSGRRGTWGGHIALLSVTCLLQWNMHFCYPHISSDPRNEASVCMCHDLQENWIVTVHAILKKSPENISVLSCEWVFKCLFFYDPSHLCSYLISLFLNPLRAVASNWPFPSRVSALIGPSCLFTLCTIIAVPQCVCTDGFHGRVLQQSHLCCVCVYMWR